MGLIRDLIHGAREQVKETIRPQKTAQEATPQEAAPSKPQHHAHHEHVHQNENVEKHDVEKNVGVATPVEKDVDDEAAAKKKAKREKMFKIFTIYGFITSIIALAQAISTKQSDPLILANIILTFGAAVLNFSIYIYRKRVNGDIPKAILIPFVLLIFLANLAGIGVCIALLVQNGASYSWILTLLFHVLPVVLIPYLVCQAMGNKK